MRNSETNNDRSIKKANNIYQIFKYKYKLFLRGGRNFNVNTMRLGRVHEFI